MQYWRPGFNPWVGKIWRREWLPTPVFLLGEFHGAWRATIHGVTKSQTWLEWLTLLQLSPKWVFLIGRSPSSKTCLRNLGSFHTVKWVKVTHLCPTLWDPMNYSLPGSSVHGILQARIQWLCYLTLGFKAARTVGKPQWPHGNLLCIRPGGVLILPTFH